MVQDSEENRKNAFVLSALFDILIPIEEHNRLRTWDFFHFHTSVPCFLRLFALGNVMPACALHADRPPPHSPPLHSGDAVSPIAKAEKTTGLPLSCSKKHPLPLNG
jgi:hypothetical protein